jgi:N-acetylneuraminate lyase
MSIQGIIPAIHTAFDERGQLDPARQGFLVERLIAQGVHGLFVGGSTGEFPLLSTSERERLLETVIEAARGRLPVIAHAGAMDPRDSIRLAGHARRVGAGGVSSLPPLYYRPREQEILAHFRAVAEAAAPLPFYAYHIPELTGVPFLASMVPGLLEIPNFAGLKWSDPDLFGLARTVDAFGGRAAVLSGKDEVLIAALALGARGAIGSTYNFLAPWFVAAWDRFQGGRIDEARALQSAAGRVIAVVLSGDGGLSSSKAAVAWAGADCGEPRPPLRRFSAAERQTLEAQLEAAGLPRGGLGKVDS